MTREPRIRIRVAACIVDGERILLAEHAREGSHYWLLPGGGVEFGETLHAAVTREVLEESALQAAVGRLILVCETIEPAGRHTVHLVYTATVAATAPLVAGLDGRLVGVAWRDRAELRDLDVRPHLAEPLLECWGEDFTGPVRDLGNVWVPG